MEYILEEIIEGGHTLVALILAIISVIIAVTVLLRKMKELKEAYRELKLSFKKGGKFKMTTPVKKFLIFNACLFIGLGIFGVRAFTEPIPILRAPFDVTLYFRPSGWMGDGGGESGTEYIQLKTASGECHRSGDTDGCIKISYHPNPNGEGWAGIYWQYPDKNWGDERGRKIEGAKKLVFWAKGERGGEIVEFKAGGITGKEYQDSFEVVRRIRLTSDWTEYEMSLSNENLSCVIGAFAWIASRNANPEGLTFYIDEIRYE